MSRTGTDTDKAFIEETFKEFMEMAKKKSLDNIMNCPEVMIALDLAGDIAKSMLRDMEKMGMIGKVSKEDDISDSFRNQSNPSIH
jgi:hypothetical protein